MKALIGSLFDEVGRLIRLELCMAQAETSKKIDRAQAGVMMVALGLLLGTCALLILLQAIVIALAAVMPAWLASIVVAVAVAAVAFVLVRHGKERLSLRGLMPDKALRALRHDEDVVSEKVSS